MPIKPENKGRYPKDWPQIRERILARAQGRCEQCGVVNRAWGFRDRDGVFQKVNKQMVIDAVKRGNVFVKPPIMLGDVKVIEIVCTVAHLDHTPEHCSDDNLKLLCQRCHLAYDAEHHKQTAYSTRREGRAIDMFTRLQHEPLQGGE